VSAKMERLIIPPMKSGVVVKVTFEFLGSIPESLNMPLRMEYTPVLAFSFVSDHTASPSVDHSSSGNVACSKLLI